MRSWLYHSYKSTLNNTRTLLQTGTGLAQNPKPYDTLYNPTFHFIFHFLFHLILAGPKTLLEITQPKERSTCAAHSTSCQQTCSLGSTCPFSEDSAAILRGPLNPKPHTLFCTCLGERFSNSGRSYSLRGLQEISAIRVVTHVCMMGWGSPCPECHCDFN